MCVLEKWDKRTLGAFCAAISAKSDSAALWRGVRPIVGEAEDAIFSMSCGESYMVK